MTTATDVASEERSSLLANVASMSLLRGLWGRDRADNLTTGSYVTVMPAALLPA